MGDEIEMITAPPQNSSPLPNLPEIIITEILLRLPAKSLLKFRCVSKSWLFLISSYEFAKAHLTISTKNNIYEHDRLIVVGSTESRMDLYTCSLRPAVEKNTVYTGLIYPNVDILSDVVRFGCPFDNIHGLVWAEGSCNGLVCVVESGRTAILWNPTIRKYRVLPCSGTYLRFKKFLRNFGFGYDALHDDYKVVEILNLGRGMSQAKVYSLRNNCWKALLNWPNENLVFISWTFLNGAIHWIVFCASRSHKWAIVSHDLALETCAEFPLQFFEDDAVYVEIKLLGGCLSLCCEYEMYLDVWLLKEYGVMESWTKVVRVEFCVNIGGYSSVRPDPLLLMVDGRMLIKYGSELRLYDPRNPHIHQFFHDNNVKVATYFETLVSPNLDDEIIIGRTFPQDVITEILLRSPVKSLLRFKCVSKEWLSLISSSYFVKVHLKVSTNNNVHIHDKLIFGSHTFPIDLYTCSIYSLIEDSVLSDPVYPTADGNVLFDQVTFDCPFAEPDGLVQLVGSCNGLVCVSLPPNILVLWNPTIRKSNLIPDSGTDKDFESYAISYAFGYDELHDDYKVVEVFGAERETGEYEYDVKAYSMRTNSWKIVSNWPGGHTFGGAGTFLNGAIHWSMHPWDERVTWAIVSHDLATDTFIELPIPVFDDNDVRVEVHILGGCLALHCEHNVHMDVWVMKEYGKRESWTKVMHIPFFLDFRDHEFIRPIPLFLSADGKILINYSSTIQIYDQSNPQLHQFGTDFEVETITYVESLVSPYLHGSLGIPLISPDI